MNDFIIEKVLGKGSFGSVYLVRRKEDNRIYALKSVILEKLNKKEQQNSVNEVRILASVNHPNVIGYKEAFWDDNENTLNIVMEYADDGDLQTKIIKMRKEGGMFQEDLIWSYSIQMIEGLKALHDKKIMHRDLKSANIFLVKDKHQCKLGDMNVSKVIKEKELLTQTGTPYYASPEVWRDEPYSYKSDLWSIGCVIYELCALRPPFKGKDLDELFMNVCKGKVERISRVYSDDLWKMILMLLKVDVNKRCDCDKFLNSELITKKIQEMKNQNKDYKNLEKNKEINDGDLLETIRFDNILEIKKQLPTKKNYSNNNVALGSEKNNNKKMNKRKNMNININSNLDKNNMIGQPIKYKKINNKNKKILYNNKNLKVIEKKKPLIKNEELEEEKEQKILKEIEIQNNEEKIKEENDLGKICVGIEPDSQTKNEQNQENENSVNNININNNIESKDNSSLKNSIIKKKKYLKNSPTSNNKAIIYQKPKLYENSIKRDKKNFLLNNKSMTTKRTTKKLKYMQRNITPRKGMNEKGNKSQNIASINKKISSLRNKNIYKSGYTAVNREKAQKYLSRPIETSPSHNFSSNMNNSNTGLYLNIIKKKNYSKKLQNDIIKRPQSITPSTKNARINNNSNNLLDKNMTDANFDNENNINLNNKELASNRENMVNMLINNYNRKNMIFNNYNDNIHERPLTTNNTKNNIKSPLIGNPQYEIKNAKKIKYPYNKIKSREKQSLNKKRIINKDVIDRDLTEPEILKMIHPIKVNEQKREYQRTLNISLNNQEQNTFLHQQKANKMIKNKTNNNPRYNQYYSNNESQNNNPQIFNNFVSINNLVTPNFPVKVINVFGQ